MDIACVMIRGRGNFRFLAPLAVVLAVAASGCARTAGRAGSYVRDRGLDLVDCFHVGAGCGLGADVQVRATDLFTVGAGAISARQFVRRGRGPWTSSRFRHVGPPLTTAAGIPMSAIGLLGYLGGRDEWREFFLGFATAGLLLLAGDCTECESDDDKHGGLSVLGVNLPVRYWPLPRSQKYAGWRDRALGSAEPIHAFDLEVGASALWSFRVGFSPGQFLDFLVGWTTLDIAGDDAAPEGKPKAQ